MHFTSYSEFLKFLNSTIPNAHNSKFPAERGLTRTRAYLQALGNPQNQPKVVHIAGTSGKGSTAKFCAALLRGQGFKVGLTISPYMLDLRERLEINGELPSQEQVLARANEVVTVYEKFPDATYFELLMILAFQHFAVEKVDFAVVETGLGGTFDASNTISRVDKLSVISRLGIDHAQILGNTIAEIASHKAGVIQPGNTIIALKQTEEEANMVIAKRAKTQKAKLIWHNLQTVISNVEVSAGGTNFDYHTATLELPGLELRMLGAHQAENASLALHVVEVLSAKFGFEIAAQKVRNSLKLTSFLGRLHVTKNINGRSIIFDGAHNPQKVASLIAALKSLYPKRKFDMLVAFKTGKDYTEMLKALLPFTHKLLVSEFQLGSQDMLHLSISASELQEQATMLGYANVETVHGASDLVRLINQSFGAAPLVVTGSLYFLAYLFPLVAPGPATAPRD